MGRGEEAKARTGEGLPSSSREKILFEKFLQESNSTLNTRHALLDPGAAGYNTPKLQHFIGVAPSSHPPPSTENHPPQRVITGALKVHSNLAKLAETLSYLSCSFQPSTQTGRSHCTEVFKALAPFVSPDLPTPPLSVFTFLLWIWLHLVCHRGGLFCCQPHRGVWGKVERHGRGRRKREAAAAAAAGLQSQGYISRASLGRSWCPVTIWDIQYLGRKQSLRGARKPCHR